MSAAPLEHGRWVDAIGELAAIVRPSASEGERSAAEAIARDLRRYGCEVTVEAERAHGGYWWPIGLANGVAVGGALLAGRSRRVRVRIPAAIAAGVAAAALWDDLGQGHRWLR